MKSAICTLFEGDYHYGVGALANSLYTHGFRGTIYAGYRGALPPWVGKNEKLESRKQKLETEGYVEFSPAEGLTIRFIPLATKIHFTNYKPDFMLEIWEKHCPQAEAMFYFDPDITIKCRWTFFEEWVQAGVAVCADVNPSMPANHPIRHAWKQFYTPHGIGFQRELAIYFNGGFLGLRRNCMGFLKCWQRLQELMAPEINGLQNVNLRDRTFLFCKTDQDALNIATMTSESPISPMGQDGMDFQHGGGGYVMSHALGGKKPWNKQFVRTVIRRAAPPSRADKQFFQYVEFPIRLYPPGVLRLKRLWLLTASFLGRFMRSM